MRVIPRSKFPSLKALMTIAIVFGVALLCLGLAQVANAKSDDVTSVEGRLITIHDRGSDQVVLSKAGTIGEVLKQADVYLDEHDMVEPSLDTTLVATNYHVNIYRARPVIVVDGNARQKVMTPYQTPEQIAEDAGVTLYDEDTATVDRIDNMMLGGAGLEMTIERSTPFTLVLYGKKTEARTTATTVGAMLEAKDITLGEQDDLSVAKNTPITKGMTVKLWRNGVQTVTEKEAIDFPVKQIQDADRPVGYSKVKTPGVKGQRTVTYEVVMRNGEEVSRKEINSVVTKEPTQQVEIVGAKPSFSGDFAAALAKLRACEGGYDSWNPAGPYYGAYQFNERTWYSVTDAPYGNATPAQQDQAARDLYERRGWQPWPHCGAGLPDIYR